MSRDERPLHSPSEPPLPRPGYGAAETEDEDAEEAEPDLPRSREVEEDAG